MNIEDVNSTIAKLENEDTDFGTCEKLASLYIVRDYYLRGHKLDGNGVEQEIKDILPQYRKYIDIKRRYQLGEVSEKTVEMATKNVCIEITEMIQALYTGTDMPEERVYINKMIDNLQNIIMKV